MNYSRVEVLSYAAGFVDGEGCISIHKQTRSDLTRGFRFSLHVEVCSTNEGIIDWFVSTFGGAKDPHKAGNIKHKDSFRWHLFHVKARQFLELIQPYLKIKCVQASLGVEFQRIRSARCYPKMKKTDEDYRKEETMAELMHKLNKRGRNEN